MTDMLAGLANFGGVLFAANELRGLIAAGPALVGMYHAGGTPMAIYLGACLLAGIGLSVIGPLFVVRKLKLLAAPDLA